MIPHPSPNTMMDLIAGHRVTAVIYVAAKLGLADLLTDGPRTATDRSVPRRRLTFPRCIG